MVLTKQAEAWTFKLSCLFLALFANPLSALDQEGEYLSNLLQNPDFILDVDRDRSPDYWVKVVDPQSGFHPYGRIELVLDRQNPRLPNVQFGLNGTDVCLENHDTALVRVDPLSSYHLKVEVQTEHCAFKDVQAGLGVIWLDTDQSPLREDWTKAVYENKDGSRREDWSLLELDIKNVPPKASWARIRMGLFHNPEGLRRVNVKGRGWFRSIKFTRRPRVEIIPESESLIFSNKAKHKFTFQIQGLKKGTYQSVWEVTDFLGKTVDEDSYLIKNLQDQGESEREVFLNLDESKGWFNLQFRLETKDDQGHIVARENKIFGVGPKANELNTFQAAHELGIDLQSRKISDSVDVIGDLVEFTRTAHVTLTLWNSQFDSRKTLSETFSGELVGRMNEANVKIQAVLGYIPPESQGEYVGSNLFSFLSGRRIHWEPVLKTTGRQYAEIESWVVGAEEDTSIVEQGSVAAPMIREVRKLLKIPGIRLGLPIGDILSGQTISKNIYPRAFNNLETFSFLQPFKGREANEYLDLQSFDRLLIPPGGNLNTLEQKPEKIVRLALKPENFSIEERLESMVFGTLYLLNRGADRVNFRLQPPQMGLVDKNNDFLPEFFAFRTMTEIFAPVKIIGSIDFPANSNNLILEFQDGNFGSRMAVLVWNDKGPVTEEIFLGDNLKSLDLMGNRKRLPPIKRVNQFTVNRIPKFLVDLDEELMRTRLSVVLGRPRVDSRLREVRQNIEITNFLKEKLSGTLELSLPEKWTVIGTGKFKIPTMKTLDRRIVGFQIRPDNFETTGKQIPIILSFTFDGNTRPPMKIFKRFNFDSRSVQVKFQFPDESQDILPVDVSVRNIGGGQIDLIAYNATIGRKEDSRFIGLMRPGESRSVTFFVQREDVEKKRVTIGVKENGGIRRFINRHIEFVNGQLSDVE